MVLRTLLPLISKVGLLSYLRIFRISDVKDLMRDGGFEILESEVFEGRIPSCFVIARNTKHSDPLIRVSTNSA